MVAGRDLPDGADAVGPVAALDDRRGPVERQREQCLDPGAIDGAGRRDEAVVAAQGLAGIGAVLLRNQLEGRAGSQRGRGSRGVRERLLAVRRDHGGRGGCRLGRHEDRIDVAAFRVGRIRGHLRLDLRVGDREALGRRKLTLVDQVHQVLSRLRADVLLARLGRRQQAVPGGRRPAGGRLPASGCASPGC